MFYLGHVITREGVSTDPAKIDKVAKWPTPQSAREVQQFLGLAGYYRRFVRNFATIAKPLHRLTEKTARFEWTPECHEAFQILRQRLCSAPILVFQYFNKPFILDTDASNTGIGGVLSQLNEAGNECVIAYASQTLSKTERQYCVTRRELLAVVTFTQHFRPYLLGRQFTLRTDHGSLTWLQSFKEPEGRSASPVAGEVTRVPVYHCPQTRQKACECGRLVTLAMHSMWKRKPPSSGARWERVVSKVCTCCCRE